MDDLKLAVYLHSVCFVLPISVLQKYIYTRYRNEDFHWTGVMIVNIWIPIQYTFALIKYRGFETVENMGMGLEMPPR